MEKNFLYNILDICDPSEFKYYENVELLIEESEFIDEDLIFELLRSLDLEFFKECIQVYFEEFIRNIPDEENELMLLVESISLQILGYIKIDLDYDGYKKLAKEIFKFREWYTVKKLVYDKNSNKELSVCDARYNLVSTKYTGEEYLYDFRLAYEYDLDGYDVNLIDIIN